jgi:predicted NAD-dependent protein-ADP-ribosyltransferase YbiA (DUF1768 family)
MMTAWYISPEQYMMAAKAKVHKEMSTHESIMLASTQAEIKQLGRMMPNYFTTRYKAVPGHRETVQMHILN